MGKKRNKSFPDTLYIKRERDGDVTYFTARENILGTVEVGEKADIAIYELRSVRPVEGTVKVHEPSLIRSKGSETERKR